VIDKNWHTSTESWYQWMKQVPNLAYSPPAGSTLPPVRSHSAGNRLQWRLLQQPDRLHLLCAGVGDRELPGAADWGAQLHFNSNEYFDDIVRQRTGTKTRYSEHSVGWGIGRNHGLFRPEVRYERSYDNPAYQNGTKKSPVNGCGRCHFLFLKRTL